ncbi:MAG: hypothetical protein JNM25_15865 [Planctomycetes bacterium]|nr:hypothetical protein [Planctomycetota bacterium]
MNWSDETKDRLGTALNEADLLGIELDLARRTVAVTFAVLAEPEPADRRLQFVLSPVGRVAASLRQGARNDTEAEVVPFAPEQLPEVVQRFGGQPIHGWEFFDVHERDFPRWSDRLSLDWRSGDGERGMGHSLLLFQAGHEQHLDVCIWFDELEVRDAAGRPVAFEDLCEGGRRFWHSVQGGGGAAAAPGIAPLAPPTDADAAWTRHDVRLGLLFLVLGVLVTGYALAAARNDVPTVLWSMGWVLGPLLLLLGGNAVWRSLRAPR